MTENRFSCPSDAMSPDSAPPVSFHSHMGTASGNCWTETKRGEASGAGATNKMPAVIAGNARMAHSPFFKRMERILYQRYRGDKLYASRCSGGLLLKAARYRACASRTAGAVSRVRSSGGHWRLYS